MSLPSGYTRVEYIESTGTQYIDTEIKPNQDTRLVMDAQPTATPAVTQHRAFFGVRADSKYFELIKADGSSLKVYYLWSTIVDSNMTFDIDWTARTTFEINKNTARIGSASLTHSTTPAFQSAYAMYLCGTNNAGTAAYITPMRIYGCQIYDNGVLVRDFVPVVRQDGTAGLLDQVNEVFYANAGSGTGVFVAGPEVPKEPEEPDVPDVPEEPNSPEVPAGLVCNGTTMGVAILSWGATNGLQNYRLYRDDTLIYEGENLTYTDTELEPGTQYTYSVSAFVDSEESEAVSIEVETKTEMWLIYDRTLRDLVERTDKSFYNALDMIRVGEAMECLERHFYDVGISIFVSPKIDWNIFDVPSLAQAEKYLTDIKTVRSKLSEFRDASEIPGSMTGFNWDMANRIEAIMFDAEKLILDIIKSYRLICGRTISGVNCLP